MKAMKIIAYIFLESYIFTLFLHLAHRSPFLSFHTFWVSMPGSLIILSAGGLIALVTYCVNRILGNKNNIPFLVWAVSVALIGILLISGSEPIPLGFEVKK